MPSVTPLTASGRASATQFGNPAPLDLVRATPETAWTIPEPPPPPKIMAADAKPEFEVSTIKPSKPDARWSAAIR